MSFTQKEIKQIKKYANAVRELSLGVEIKSKTVLLQDGNHVAYGTTQAPPDINGLEEQKMAYMRKMLFLLVRDFRPISRLYERKMPGRVQTLKDTQQQIQTEMKGRNWVYVDRDENLITIPFCPGDSIELFVEELLSDVESEAAQGKTKKKSDNLKQLPKKFQPWKYSGDACFIIDGNKIMFHYKDIPTNLRLKAESNTYRLLHLLAGGSLQADEIQKQIIPGKTNKACKIVDYANGLLNKKIPMVGFVGVPSNVEFIKRDRFGSYSLSLKLHTKESFDELQGQISY